MSQRVPAPRIYACLEWGAVPPKGKTEGCGTPRESIFHHTASHHAEISQPKNESLDEAFRYARDIQHFHMEGNGWIDSGHNFLITRAGHILQGRWGTVHAIEHGLMVISAHCPGHNDQPGVEHEHKGTELMNEAQYKASVALFSWVHDRCNIYGGKIFPHGAYYATACPGILLHRIPDLRRAVEAALLRSSHPARNPRLLAGNLHVEAEQAGFSATP